MLTVMAENHASGNWPALEKKNWRNNKVCWNRTKKKMLGKPFYSMPQVRGVVPEAEKMRFMLQVSVAQRQTIVASVHIPCQRFLR